MGFLARSCASLRIHLARRHAVIFVAGTFSFPHATTTAISNPWDKGEVNLKPRVEKKKMRPDGFGGYVEREEVVSPGINLDFELPMAAETPRVPTLASRQEKQSATSSSTPALTFEQLVENSVRSKEEIIGRKLEPDEVAQIK